jgi:hypothetical protein
LSSISNARPRCYGICIELCLVGQRYAPAERLSTAVDNHEQTIEAVCHPTGDATERFQPPPFVECRLGSSAQPQLAPQQ